MNEPKKSLSLALDIKRAQSKKQMAPSAPMPEMEENPKSIVEAIMKSRKKPELEPTFEDNADELDPLAYEPGFDDMEIEANMKPAESDELDRSSRVDKIRARLKALRS